MNPADPFAAAQSRFGLKLSGRQREQVEEYWRLLRKWNRRISLTRIADFREALELHFFESFWAAERFLGDAIRVADIGSGAGFPGLAMAIWRPELRPALLERSRKKAVFLREAAKRLGLEAEVFAGRAEEYPGWGRVEAAAVRALKPSRELLGILKREGIPLVAFHSSAAAPAFGALERREKAPAGRDRHVSRYRL